MKRDLQKIEGRKSHSEKQQIFWFKFIITKQQTDKKFQNQLKKKMDYQKQKNNFIQNPDEEVQQINRGKSSLDQYQKNTNLTKEDSCQE